MAQDCFLTFGICRQMIMMQPGKLSILPLESKQWGLFSLSNGTDGWITFPIAFPNAAFAVDITHYNSASTAVNIYLEISYVSKEKCYVRSSQNTTECFMIAIGN